MSIVDTVNTSDETEWRRLAIKSLSGHPYEILAREDDCIRDVKRQLTRLTWAHVELVNEQDQDLLKDAELVKSLPNGKCLHMVLMRSQLVMACVGKHLILWGCQCGSVQTLKRFDSAPTALLADVLSQRVVVGCTNGQVELVKVKRSDTSDTTFTRFPRVKGYVQSIQAFWDDDLVLVAHNKNLSIYTITEEDIRCIACIEQPEEVRQIAVGVVGRQKQVISACLDYGPVILNLSNLDVPNIRMLHGGNRQGCGTALDVDWKKQRIVAGTTRGVLQLWSFSAGGLCLDKEMLQQGRQPDIRAIAAHWSKDRAITASSDGALRLWDLDDGSVISQISGHGALIWSISADFDFDAGQMCSAGFDGTVKLWRIKDHIELISEMPQSAKESCMVTSIIPAGAAACQLLNSLGPHEDLPVSIDV